MTFVEAVRACPDGGAIRRSGWGYCQIRRNFGTLTEETWHRLGDPPRVAHEMSFSVEDATADDWIVEPRKEEAP